MITLVQKIHIFFWKVWEDILYVFHFVVTIILKIKIAVENTFSGFVDFIKNSFKYFLDYFNSKINVLLQLSKNPNFAYAKIKSENRNSDYKSLAPPSF